MVRRECREVPLSLDTEIDLNSILLFDMYKQNHVGELGCTPVSDLLKILSLH